MVEHATTRREVLKLIALAAAMPIAPRLRTTYDPSAHFDVA
jgi:hypothetical protein